jgi:hypothetical protein
MPGTGLQKAAKRGMVRNLPATCIARRAPPAPQPIRNRRRASFTTEGSACRDPLPPWRPLQGHLCWRGPHSAPRSVKLLVQLPPPDPAMLDLKALTHPFRSRVICDVEGWLVIPGRLGQIEPHDGQALAVYTTGLGSSPGCGRCGECGVGRSGIKRPEGCSRRRPSRRWPSSSRPGSGAGPTREASRPLGIARLRRRRSPSGAGGRVRGRVWGDIAPDGWRSSSLRTFGD